MSAAHAICECTCHAKYGEKSICGKCVDRHKTSPYYNILKKFE